MSDCFCSYELKTIKYHEIDDWHVTVQRKLDICSDCKFVVSQRRAELLSVDGAHFPTIDNCNRTLFCN